MWTSLLLFSCIKLQNTHSWLSFALILKADAMCSELGLKRGLCALDRDHTTLFLRCCFCSADSVNQNWFFFSFRERVFTGSKAMYYNLSSYVCIFWVKNSSSLGVFLFFKFPLVYLKLLCFINFVTEMFQI